MQFHFTMGKLVRSLVVAIVLGGAPLAATVAGHFGASPAFADTFTAVETAYIYGAGHEQNGEVILWQDNFDGYLHTETKSFIGSVSISAGVWIQAAGGVAGLKSGTGTDINSATEQYPQPTYYEGYGCVAGTCTYTGAFWH